MSHTQTQRAIEAYHHLAESETELTEASAQDLMVRQPPARLTFGGRPLCGVLRPHFLAAAEYSRIQTVARVLCKAMFRLAETMVAEPALLDMLHLTAAERDVVSIDPGYRDVSPTSRLDSFMTQHSYKFVEYNAETPAAIAYQDCLGEVFFDLPLVKEFQRLYSVTALPARRRLLDALLDAYRQWGGKSVPVIAIVDWDGLPTATEFQLFAEYFQAANLETHIVRPDQLSYDGARLRADGHPIDIVYRRILIHELLKDGDLAKPLVEAYRAHHVCVVNSFRAKLLHKKVVFALLTDERYAHHFTPEERKVIDSHVPWTRYVADGATTHAGQRIDLLSHIQQNRDQLVLKPNDEYGGKGVQIGWISSQSEWEKALRAALETPHVVQERVPVERVSFPLWGDAGLEWANLAVDLDPYLFGTEVTGMLTRLSAAALLNVTAGTGSLTPTFLVEPR